MIKKVGQHQTPTDSCRGEIECVRAYSLRKPGRSDMVKQCELRNHKNWINKDGRVTAIIKTHSTSAKWIEWDRKTPAKKQTFPLINPNNLVRWNWVWYYSTSLKKSALGASVGREARPAVSDLHDRPANSYGTEHAGLNDRASRAARATTNGGRRRMPEGSSIRGWSSYRDDGRQRLVLV